jgi:hypothetical protein
MKKRYGLESTVKKLTMDEVAALGYVRKAVAPGEDKCINCMNRFNNNICKKVVCRMSYWEDPKFKGAAPLRRAYFAKKRSLKLLGE